MFSSSAPDLFVVLNAVLESCAGLWLLGMGAKAPWIMYGHGSGLWESLIFWGTVWLEAPRILPGYQFTFYIYPVHGSTPTAFTYIISVHPHGKPPLDTTDHSHFADEETGSGRRSLGW